MPKAKSKKKICFEEGVSILMVTHDRYFLERITKKIAYVLENIEKLLDLFYKMYYNVFIKLYVGGEEYELCEV